MPPPPPGGGDGGSDENEAGTWRRRLPPPGNMANSEAGGYGVGSTHGGYTRGSGKGYLRAPVAWYPEVIWT